MNLRLEAPFDGRSSPSRYRLAAEQSGKPSAEAARAIANLRWRSIGPNNFAGRIVDIVGVLAIRPSSTSRPATKASSRPPTGECPRESA
jgi:hypothetical protein